MIRFRLLWKYILFYLIVSIIPIISIIAYFYPMAKQVLINKTMSNNYHITTNITNTMNIHLSSVYNIAREVKVNSKLTPYSLSKNSYAEIEAVEELRKLMASTAFISDIILYYKDNETFYTSQTLIRLENFDSRYQTYKFVDTDMEEFLDFISHQERPIALPARPMQVANAGIRDMVTFIFPLISGENGINTCTALLLVENSSIQKVIDIYSSEYGDNVLVLDYEGNLITATNDNHLFSESQIQDIIHNYTLGASEILEINGTEYILSYDKSKTNGWRYLSYIEMDALVDEINRLKNNSIVIILVILFFETILIALFSRRTYQPIRLLVDDSRKVFEDNGSVLEKQDEIGTIQHVLRTLSKNNDELNTKIQDAYPAMKADLLKQLINGQIGSQEEFNGKGRELGLQLPYPTYSAAVISFVTKSGDLDYEQVDNYLGNLAVPEGIRIYSVYDVGMNLAILVSCFEKEGPYHQLLEKLQKNLWNDLGLRTYVGISNASYDVRDFHFLYIQAISAIEFLQQQKNIFMMNMEELQLNTYEFRNYPTESFHRLEVALMKKDPDRIRTVVADLERYMEDYSVPVYFMRILYRNIMGYLVKEIVKYTGTSEEDKIIQLNRYLLEVSYSPEDLLGKISACTDEICLLIQKNAGEESEHTFQSILEYIDNHYLDMDFSIQTVAEHFSITVSNFSHYFKKHGNVNFKQYVDFIKIGQAKELLRSTDKSLEDISELLSYSNVSSFIRAFKRISNMTPGEYRKTLDNH